MRKSKPIHSLPCKVALMGLYAVFFFVQLFLQYHTSSLSQVKHSYKAAAIKENSSSKVCCITSLDEPSGYKKSIRLSKRYHPETPLEMAAVYETGIIIYSVAANEFFTATPFLQNRTMSGCLLRGPPTFG